MSDSEAFFDQATIQKIRRRIMNWGRAHFQDYPWRSETDSWLTLVAELMLQRTRAAQVVPVFMAFREQYHTASALVEAGPDEAHRVTAALGLHGRGPQLYELAAAVAKAGQASSVDPTGLSAIAGIGPYTYAAWLSLHQGKRAILVDSNVYRWLGRMTGQQYGRDPRGIRWLNELADQLTPQRVFRDYNYSVLDFTMLVCRPRNPSCDICPVANYCEFRNERTPADRPRT